MLKTTLMAAAAVSFLALGASTADAKDGHHGDRGNHGDYGNNGKHGNYGKHGKHGNHGNYGNRGHNKYWFNYSWYQPRCTYELRPTQVRWHGHWKTIWRNVQVCY